MDYIKLKELVLYHNQLYYDEAKPEISDAEYDKLYEQLEEEERKRGFKDWDSPTNRVGHTRGSVKHPYKLYSLQKAYSEEEVPSEYDIKTRKLDGARVAHIYKDGHYFRTLSRGDGEMGEDLTHLFKPSLADSFIPELKDYDCVVIDGECVTFQQVENYRNYVAGAINLKDFNEFVGRNIEFIAHDVLGVELDYRERLSLICKQYKTVLHNEAELQQIPADGEVFRLNSFSESQKLGYTSKYPKFAVALKTRAKETALTVLEDVIWSIGRTGIVAPVGLVTPVVIGGATVSRLTLNNISFIEDNDICIGDRIEIERAGEIIPTYVRTVEKSPIRMKITIQNAEEGIGNKVTRVGPRFYVADKSVNDEKVLLNFISCMNIQGLGPASIKKLGLTHISDLYKPQKWESLGANGVKISQEIEYSKTKPYENVLSGLSIPNVGASLARKIIERIPRFSDLPQIQYEKIDKVGPKITEKIVTWYEENSEWVKKLPVNLEQHITIDSSARMVCITGTLDRTRKEIAEILQQKGFDVKNSVTKKTYALITDGKIESDKTETAKKYGVKIVNYFEQKQSVLDGIF